MNVILFDKTCVQSCQLTEQNQVIIQEAAVINHIKSVLKAGIGDVLKVGQIGGYLGVAQIAQMTADQLVLSHVRLDTLQIGRAHV